MTSSRASATVLRAAQAATIVLLAAYVAQALIPAAATHVGDFFENWVYPGLWAPAAAFCLPRPALHRRERAAWIVLGLGILASAAGDVWWYLAQYDARETIPAFTPADAL